MPDGATIKGGKSFDSVTVLVVYSVEEKICYIAPIYIPSVADLVLLLLFPTHAGTSDIAVVTIVTTKFFFPPENKKIKCRLLEM